MAQTPEGRVKEAVKRFLKERGLWYTMPVSNGMGSMGVPDFLICWDGRFLAIEAKAPGRIGNTSALQKRQIEGIRSSGGFALVIDDVNMLEEFFNGHRE